MNTLFESKFSSVHNDFKKDSCPWELIYVAKCLDAGRLELASKGKESKNGISKNPVTALPATWIASERKNDMWTQVCRQTGFAGGLFSPDEQISSNMKVSTC